LTKGKPGRAAFIFGVHLFVNWQISAMSFDWLRSQCGLQMIILRGGRQLGCRLGPLVTGVQKLGVGKRRSSLSYWLIIRCGVS